MLLDKLTNPYQAGDSLIIYQPVFLFSKPVDIYGYKKHKSKGPSLETVLQFFELRAVYMWSVETFIRGRK